MEAKRIAKNSFFNGLSIFIDRLGAIIFTIIVARILQPELFGLYTLAISIGYIFMGFTDLGVNTSQVVWVSAALGRDDEKLARSYFRYFLKIKFLLIAIVSLLVFFFSSFLASLFGIMSASLLLQMVSLFIAIQSFINFFLEFFQSVQNFKYRVLFNFIIQTARIILVPILLIAAFSVESAVIGLIASLFLTIFCVLYIMLKHYKFMFFGDIIHFERKIILKFISWLTIGSAASMVFGYFDVLLIGIFLPVENVGFYRAATSIVFSAAGVLTAVTSGVFLPIFSQRKIEDIRAMFSKCIRYSAMLSAPFVFITVLFNDTIISIFYGSEYMLASLPLMVISFIILENVLSSFYGLLLSAQKYPHYSAYIVVVSSLINIALNYFLILSMGFVGAAYALLISRFFYFFLMAAVTKIKLDILPSLSSVIKPLLSAIVTSLIFILIPQTADILSEFVKILFFICLYFAVLFIMKGVEKGDIEFARIILRR